MFDRVGERFSDDIFSRDALFLDDGVKERAFFLGPFFALLTGDTRTTQKAFKRFFRCGGAWPTALFADVCRLQWQTRH